MFTDIVLYILVNTNPLNVAVVPVKPPVSVPPAFGRAASAVVPCAAVAYAVEAVAAAVPNVGNPLREP